MGTSSFSWALLFGLTGRSFRGPALLPTQRRRSLLRGPAGVGSDPRMSLIQVFNLAVFPTQFAAQVDDFRLARVAALCVEGQSLAQALDVLNGLPISRVVGQSLLSVHRRGELIDRRAQLVAELVRGISGRQALQKQPALEIRAQEQPSQDGH